MENLIKFLEEKITDKMRWKELLMCLSRCAAHLLKKIWFYLKPEYLLLFQKNRFFKFH